MFKHYVFTSGFICWMFIITVLSLYSFEDFETQKISIPHLDKAVHFVFYFIAGILGSLLIKERTGGQLNVYTSVIISMLFVIGYGIVIEVIQNVFTDYRSGDLYDVLANSLGAFFGGGIVFILFLGKTPLKWKD